MTTDITQNLNGMTPGPASSYRDVVPAGASHKPETETPPATSPNGVEYGGEQTTPWQRVQIARHPDRPHTLDYIQRFCPDFIEMHGDRLFGDDPAIIGGLGTLEGQAVMIIGHQKGRTTKENIARNFGMALPEGYRKAQRLMDHAARFGFPIITFIDTPGASPGMTAEERGIGQAIAASIMKMLTIEVPIIATVIGEGGSGGAIALGAADRVLMLENSIYSVASPESSAAILWRDAGQAAVAAEMMRITAPDLLQFGLIDEIVPEPDGGAHTDAPATLEAVRDAILRCLAGLQESYALHTKKGARKLLEDRHAKYERMGAFVDPQQGAQEEADD